MATKHNPKVLSSAYTLPARYYIDPELFAVERERFFANRWVWVARAEQILEAGAYILTTVADRELIVTRDEQGVLHAFHNSCRHRGTRICQQSHGRFTGRIQCPYHAWTYDLQGKLRAAPGFANGAGFDVADFPLHAAAIDEWDGHLFVHVGEPAVTLSGQLGPLPTKFRAWGMSDLRLGARREYDVAANWKLVIQNYSECLHCPAIHPALCKLSHHTSGVNEPFHQSYMGGFMDLRPEVGTMSLDGRLHRAPLPGLTGEDLRRVYYYAVFPNLLLSLHPDYVMVHALSPTSVDSTRVITEWHFHPDAVAAADFDPADAVEFWDMTNRQDWMVCEQSQLGIRSPAYQPGPYSSREELLHAFDQMVIELLRPR